MIRTKRRYIVVETSAKIGAGEREAFEKGLYSAMMAQIGEAEYFKANPKVIAFLDERRIILKVNLEKYDESVVALALIKQIDSKVMGLYSIKSSGTIKALGKAKNGTEAGPRHR
jgi:RNase P/RNase MRP subunit POP5